MFTTPVQLDTITDLLEQGADPNVPDTRGYAPIHLAYDNYEVVEMLIAFGADVNAIDGRGETALMKVTRFLLPGVTDNPDYYERVARLLIAHGAHVDVSSAVLLGEIGLLA